MQKASIKREDAKEKKAKKGDVALGKGSEMLWGALENATTGAAAPAPGNGSVLRLLVPSMLSHHCRGDDCAASDAAMKQVCLVR